MPRTHVGGTCAGVQWLVPPEQVTSQVCPQHAAVRFGPGAVRRINVSVSYSIRRAQAWRVRFGRGVGRSVIAHCSRVLQASAIESETSAESQRDASQARQLESGEIEHS